MRELHAEQFQPILSLALWREYVGTLSRSSIASRIRLTDEEIARFLQAIYKRSEFVIPDLTIALRIRDEQDTHVLAAAISGSADYLVSGDQDLLSVAGDPRLGALKIVPPRAFLNVIYEEGRPDR